MHLKQLKEQNKKLFNDEYQLRKILLNADDLILKHDIKFNNKHNFKLVFLMRWVVSNTAYEFDEKHLYFEKDE